jgi:hypothetical protein
MKHSGDLLIPIPIPIAILNETVILICPDEVGEVMAKLLIFRTTWCPTIRRRIPK